MANIFIELELFLDPPITEAEAMKEHLEKEKIPYWNNNKGSQQKFERFLARAKSYIAEGLPQLEEQGKTARDEKYGELTSQAKTINEAGATEKSRKNLVNTFKLFFNPDTIEKLVPLSGAPGIDDDEFKKPTCPNVLKCDKPVSYNDMVEISDNLRVATDGECCSLYALLEVHERDKTADILTKATAKAKEINDITNKDVKANALNRLSGKFMLFFKDDKERRKYDVAIKRFSFEKVAKTTLTHYVEGWTTKKKTDWKQYHVFIDEVKKIGYTQEEAAWLVYEYFCITKKCPLPETPQCPVCLTSNGINANACKKCGVPLKIECPQSQCRHVGSVDDKVCAKCGYVLGDMMSALKSLDSARKSLAAGKIEEAENHMRGVDISCKDAPGASTVRQLLKKLKEFETSVKEAIGKKHFFEAKRLFKDLRGIAEAPRSLLEKEEKQVNQTIEEVNKKLAKFPSLILISEKENLYKEILVLVVDCLELDKQKKAIDPIRQQIDGIGSKIHDAINRKYFYRARVHCQELRKVPAAAASFLSEEKHVHQTIADVEKELAKFPSLTLLSEKKVLIERVRVLVADCATIDAMEEPIVATERKIKNLETKIKEARDKRYFFEAKRLFQELRQFPDAAKSLQTEETEVNQTIAEVQKRLVKLPSITCPSERFEVSETILALAADCAEAADILPPPPKELRATVVPTGIELEWTAPDTKSSLKYVIVRKNGGIPASANDGTRIHDAVTHNKYADLSGEVGVVYGYAVFTQRGKTMETMGCRSDLVQKIDEIRNVSILPGDGLLTVSWKQPLAFKEMIVTRFVGTESTGEGARVLLQSESSFVDSKLNNETTYTYKIQTVFRGIDGGDVISPGKIVSAKPQVPPQAVVDLKASELDDDTVTFKWSSPPHGDVLMFDLGVEPNSHPGSIEWTTLAELKKRYGEPIPILAKGQTSWKNTSKDVRYILPITFHDGLAVFGKTASVFSSGSLSGRCRNKVKPSITCPHCWHEFATDHILYISESPDMLGDARIGTNEQMRFLPTRFDLSGAALDANGTVCYKLACPNCHLQIPRSFLNTSSFFVSIVGAPASGKSYFLASMVWQLRKTMAQYFSMNFTDADSQMNRRIREYEAVQFLGGNDPNKPVSIDKTDVGGDIYNMSLIDGHATMLAQPFTFTIMPLPTHPFPQHADQITQTVCMYDNAGEHFLPGADTLTQPVTRHLSVSDAILFLFDPTQDVRFVSACKEAVNDPQMNAALGVDVRKSLVNQSTLLTEMFAQIKTHSQLPVNAKIRIPLIIVLTKFDAWKQLVTFSPSERPWNFVSNSSVCEYNAEHVNQYSRTLRTLLLDLIPDLVSTAEANAEKVVYTAVSATGTAPEIGKDENGKSMLQYRPNNIKPFWVDVPFLQAQIMAGKYCVPVMH